MSRPLMFGLVVFIVLFITVILFGLKNEVSTTEKEIPIKEEELKEKAEEVGELTFSSDTPSESELKKESEKFNEVVQVGKVTYTLQGFTSEQNIGGVYGENAEDKFLLLEMNVKNDGIEPLLIDPSLFELVVDGRQSFLVDGVASVYGNVDTDFFLATLISGSEKSGYVIFDMPAEYHDNKLVLKVSDGFWSSESREITIQ